MLSTLYSVDVLQLQTTSNYTKIHFSFSGFFFINIILTMDLSVKKTKCGFACQECLRANII